LNIPPGWPVRSQWRALHVLRLLERTRFPLVSELFYLGHQPQTMPRTLTSAKSRTPVPARSRPAKKSQQHHQRLFQPHRRHQPKTAVATQDIEDFSRGIFQDGRKYASQDGRKYALLSSDGTQVLQAKINPSRPDIDRG